MADNRDMPMANLREHLVNGGRIEPTGPVMRLIIPPTGADAYADAQLDDYEHDLPRHFSNAPPQRLCIRARFSHREMKGTAGFGFWNHPFSRAGAVLEPPCNVWFFYSSPESDLQVARHMPGHGFKAAVLNGILPFPGGDRQVRQGRLYRMLIHAATAIANALLKLPFVSTLVMAVARTFVSAHEAMIDLDMTAWHEYAIDWQPAAVAFWVDDHEILRTPHPPDGPLGFVAWVDNYRANAGGRHYQFAYVPVADEQWMEMVIMNGDDSN